MRNRIKIFFKHLFSDSKFYNMLFKIAVPIMIQNLIASSLNIVDNFMIGKVGEIELAAVGIANQYFFLFNLIVMGIYSGCGIFISQFWGKRDVKNIKRIIGLGSIMGIIVAFIFTLFAFIIPDKIVAIFNTDPKVICDGAKYLRIVCLSYIFTTFTFNFGFASRCIGQAVLPMLVSMLALVCNAFLNYVFIFGNFGAKAMGVEGAALATTIARILESIILISYIYKKNGVLAARFREMIDLSKSFVLKVFKTVIDVVLNEGCFGLGTVVYSIIYGRIGTKAMASIQICNPIYNLFMVAIFGMANAAVVMIGNKIGEGHEEEAKKYANKLLSLSFFIGILLSVLLYLMSPFILTFFNVSDEVTYSSLRILYIMSGIMVVRIFNVMLIVGILRGGGDARCALKIEGCTMWFIGIPLAFIGAFIFKLPVHVVYGIVTIEEVVRFIISMKRFLSDKWLKSVIHGM